VVQLSQAGINLECGEQRRCTIERHCRVNIEGSTARDYEMKVNKHILPFFGGMKLTSIDEDDVLRFKEWMTIDKGYSPVTVGTLLGS
jgi:hypothetical protein